MQKNKPIKPCNVCGKTKKKHTRGVCYSCYTLAQRLVAAGKTTDTELVLDGFFDPRKKPKGRKPANPLTIKYGNRP